MNHWPLGRIQRHSIVLIRLTSVRSIAGCMLYLAFGFAQAIPPRAAEETPVPALSATARPQAKRAPWQQRLTLGPGDVLNLSLFERAETARTNVSIAPDGRISFLRTNVVATGLTIDELRARLDQALAPFYQDPRTIITPAGIHSKKYIVLGSVATRGVFPFDRPLTMIE